MLNKEFASNFVFLNRISCAELLQKAYGRGHSMGSVLYQQHGPTSDIRRLQREQKSLKICPDLVAPQHLQ